MAPSKIRQALGVVKDQTSISIAKVAGAKAPDLDVALVKACSHDEFFDDKYAEEVLYFTSLSRGYVNACIAGLNKRLSKTHNWIVALKSLMLIHRLLRDGDSVFEHELLQASRHGMRMLNLSHFRDDSDSNAWDYSSFVRTFGRFLEERLDCSVSGSVSDRRRKGRSARRISSYGRRGSGSPSRYDDRSGDTYRDDNRYSGRYDDDGGRSPRYHDRTDRYEENKEEELDDVAIKEMSLKLLLEKLPVLQQLLERLLGCRPTGAAKTNSLVQIALYPVVKESFQLYADISEGTTMLLEGFFEMEHHESVKAFEIYSRSASQGDELQKFYELCKKYGVGRSSEYPTVQKISQEIIHTMKDFLKSRKPSNSQRSKSPEPQPLQLEYRPETSKPEPAPQPQVVMRRPQAVAPHSQAVAPPSQAVAPPSQAVAPPSREVLQVEPQPVPQSVQNDGDLLNLDKVTISQQDQEDRLALALFSGTSGTTTANSSWEAFGSDQSTQANSGSLQSEPGDSGKAGWELALVASVSNLSKPTGAPMAGGFDPLLLNSMYDQGAVRHKQAAAAIPAGSASSVCIPNRPASSFLALPAPPGAMPLAESGEDPFAASAVIPPPSYVQMADMTKKQQLLTQEQLLWQKYQSDGMHGEQSFMKLHSNPYVGVVPLNSFPYYSVGMPHYGVGMPIGNYY